MHKDIVIRNADAITVKNWLVGEADKVSGKLTEIQWSNDYSPTETFTTQTAEVIDSNGGYLIRVHGTIAYSTPLPDVGEMHMSRVSRYKQIPDVIRCVVRQGGEKRAQVVIDCEPIIISHVQSLIDQMSVMFDVVQIEGDQVGDIRPGGTQSIARFAEWAMTGTPQSAETSEGNQAWTFAKGTVKGVASDIEKWIRDYAEHAPIAKETQGSEDQFTLTLYQYFFGRSGEDPIKLPYAQVTITGWSNGTTDIRMWPIPADRIYYDMEREDKVRRSDMAQMSVALLKRFPYAGAQAAQVAEAGAGDEPQAISIQDERIAVIRSMFNGGNTPSDLEIARKLIVSESTAKKLRLKAKIKRRERKKGMS